MLVKPVITSKDKILPCKNEPLHLDFFAELLVRENRYIKIAYKSH